MVEVFSSPLQKRYYAPYISFAWLFRIIYYVALLLIPLLLAHSSRGFWKKFEFNYEQPLVLFKHKLIYQLEGSTAGDILAWSTIPEYNDVIGKARTRSPSPLTVNEIDQNSDGKNDYIDISLTVPLRNGESVNRFTSILFFDYQLQQYGRVDMEAAIILQAESFLPGQKVTFNGDINFNQVNPLSSKGIKTVYSGDIIDPTKLETLADIQMESFITAVNDRNDTISFNGDSYWKSGGRNSFDINIRLNIPPTQVVYVPDANEVIKFALVQYLPFFVLIYLLFGLIREFVYSNQIFETRIHIDNNDGMRKKFDYNF